MHIPVTIGGVKALWDWIVSFLKRPKLAGTLEKTPILRGRTTSFPQLATAADLDTAFDTEIRLYVSAYNKRQEPTSLKKWVLRVQAKGKNQHELAALRHRDLSQRRGRYIDPAYLMPETIRFEWRTPVSGWLYFLYLDIHSATLGLAKYTLFAVDIENRKHRVVSGEFPAAPNERNVFWS
jgi:hypothetical protein